MRCQEAHTHTHICERNAILRGPLRDLSLGVSEHGSVYLWFTEVGWHMLNLGESWPEVALIWRRSATIGPMLAVDVDQFAPDPSKLAQCWPDLSLFGHIWSNVAEVWAKVGRILAYIWVVLDIANVGPNTAELCRPTSGIRSGTV